MPTEDREDKCDLFWLLHTLGIRRGFPFAINASAPEAGLSGNELAGFYHHSGFVRIQDTHK